MKERIRTAIKKESWINCSTWLYRFRIYYYFWFFFDVCSKKYYYLLNISPNITVLDSSICDTVRKQLLDDIFEELYEKRDKNFIKLIDDLTIKDDSAIKKKYSRC